MGAYPAALMLQDEASAILNRLASLPERGVRLFVWVLIGNPA
jgi:hypothetical protein